MRMTSESFCANRDDFKAKIIELLKAAPGYKMTYLGLLKEIGATESWEWRAAKSNLVKERVIEDVFEVDDEELSVRLTDAFVSNRFRKPRKEERE